MDAIAIAGTRSCEFADMRSEDIESVLDIEQRIYAFPWTRGNFEDSLASGYVARLLRDGKKLLGYAVMMRIADEVHLLNITVVPERQHKGLGGFLLESLCVDARKGGAVCVVLEVRESNIAGRAFYQRHGYVQIGERKDYYPAVHGREAALVLEKRL